MATILILASDDARSREAAAALSAAGFTLVRRTPPDPPSIPEVGGVDLVVLAQSIGRHCRRLVSQAAMDLPVLALATDAESQAAALADGAGACLIEPVPPPLLVAQAASLIRWHQAVRARSRVDQATAALPSAAAEHRRVALEIAELGTWECNPAAGWIRGDARCAEIFRLPADVTLPVATVLALIHPNDRQGVCASLAKASEPAGSGVYTTEYRVRRPDGSERCVVARARALAPPPAGPDEARFVGTLMDVTERHRVNEALRESEERLRLALNAAKGGAYVVDLEEDRLHVSPEAAGVYGMPPNTASLSRAEFLDRIVAADRARVDAALDEAAVTGTYRAEYRMVGHDGSVRPLASFAQFQPDTRRLVGFVMDVTDRKRAEEALRDANARLAAADRRKDEFIAVLSHELRNPLAPIRYAIPLLEREPLTETGSRAVAVIGRQVHHLTRLVDDLLDVSRITRGKIELRRERVALHHVLAAAAEAASPAVAASHHALRIELPDEPVWVDGDAARLAQVVTNLLDNSTKYTPRGGQIALIGRREGETAVIRVRDSGIGIPESDLPGVFEMFRQAHPRTSSQPGLGIGLALSKMLIEMHGGTIQAHSAGLGQGAEFVVRLPAAAEASPHPVDGQAVAIDGRRRLKVLIVDDNVDLVEMLATQVVGLGHDVRQALDGSSAVTAALSFTPDVVLLDLGLPGMSGLEVARRLRAEPQLAHARLVALTGWGQAEDRRRTAEAGFDVHLTKPTEPEALERLLARFAA